MSELSDVLVVVAHPDDEVIGCGASIYGWGMQGRKVTVLIVCENSSRHGNVEMCQFHAYNAAQVLGHDLVMLMYADQSLDKVNVGELANRIGQYVAPGMLVVTHHADLNRDHAIVLEAVKLATRRVACRVETMYVSGSTEHALVPFEPTVFRCFTPESMERKIDAIKMYLKEVKTAPHPVSPASFELQAGAWGIRCGASYAEAFHLLKEVL